MMKLSPMAARIALCACIAYLTGWPYAKADAQTSTTFQIDRAHSGAVITSQPFAPPLRSLWSVNLKGAVSYPVFAGDEVIVNVRTPGFYGARMVALSASTGHIIWQKYIAADSGTVFAATDNNMVFEGNDEGILQAFDPENGARKWILDLPNAEYIDTPLIATNGYVYVVATSGGVIFKISEMTGAIVWSQSISSAPSFVVDDKNIYLVGTCDIYSISLATSENNWHLSPGCVGGSDTIPIALDNKLIFGTNYGPPGIIVDSVTGAPKSKYIYPGVAAYYRNFMIETQMYGGNISANEQLSRHVIWNFQPTKDNLSAPPIVVNGTVYAVSDNGVLYALDASTGKLRQALTLVGTSPYGAGTYSGLGINGNILVAPSGDFLTALMPDTTKVITAPKNKSQ